MRGLLNLLLQPHWVRGQKQLKNRGLLVLSVFIFAFIIVTGRLLGVALSSSDQGAQIKKIRKVTQLRPDLIDRNGVLLATDIQLASLYADATKIQDVDEAIEHITAYLPELDTDVLRKKLTSKKSFVWIKREISPKQQSQIHDLGIPGLTFKKEYRRVYPGGKLASHVLGYVNVDNVGMAGLEKYLDKNTNEHTASINVLEEASTVQLTLDVRVQYALRSELNKAMEKYQAVGAAGIVMNVQNSEVLGLVSLPDYDPNKPKLSLEKGRYNRIVSGLYEMGSTMKAFTFAAALEAGTLHLSEKFDAREPIKVGRFKINDFHAQKRILNAREVFIHSSNIGTAKMALNLGTQGQKDFLEKAHLMEKVQTELPGSRTPKWPEPWNELATMTVSYGHGISLTPLQVATSFASLVNGGTYLSPTFFPRAKSNIYSPQRIISPQTSTKMRALLRLNVTNGSGKKADIKGYNIGGKTGTAEKVVDGKYSKDALLTSFISTFPSDAPKYMVLIMMDEPKGIPETHGHAAAGWNVVPVSGQVVKRIAPLLGVSPSDIAVHIKKPTLN